MPLPPTPTEDSWAEEIAALARTEFRTVIDIVTPGTRGTFNSKTDSFEGGTPDVVVIAERPARAQHLRQPLDQSGSKEWGTKRNYRFQIDMIAGDPLITKGMVIRVRSAPRNPSLTSFAFQVASAANSDNAALRTIETTTEFAAVPNG